jgi:phage shock protein A
MARLVWPALALLLLGAASAFVPTLRSTTGWSPCSAGAHARPALGARARAAPPLHMNMFDRFTRVAKANANKLLEKMEDPEKVLSQAVEDLQKDLVAVRQSYAEVMATQKRMKSQKEQADALGDEWYSRAQLALTKGDDELAKEALTRRQTQVDTAESLASQLAIQEASLTKLYDSMTLLENKITEAKGMKDQMIARARTAKTATKVRQRARRRRRRFPSRGAPTRRAVRRRGWGRRAPTAVCRLPRSCSLRHARNGRSTASAREGSGARAALLRRVPSPTPARVALIAGYVSRTAGLGVGGDGVSSRGGRRAGRARRRRAAAVDGGRRSVPHGRRRVPRVHSHAGRAGGWGWGMGGGGACSARR